MSSDPKILAFAGSTRKKSFNKRLVRVAARGARQAGGEVTVIDLADYPLPLFDEDLEREAGMPENGKRLRQIFADHSGLLVSSPEYNGSVSAVFKNTIDWLSRRDASEDPALKPLAGKTVALMSASPGGLGGLRGLVHVRAILGNLGMIVLPAQRAVSAAHQAFDEDGDLNDPKLRQAIEGLGAGLVDVVRKLS